MRTTDRLEGSRTPVYWFKASRFTVKPQAYEGSQITNLQEQPRMHRYHDIAGLRVGAAIHDSNGIIFPVETTGLEPVTFSAGFAEL